MRHPAVKLAGVLWLFCSGSALAGQCLESSSPGKICTANDFEVVSEELVSGPANCTDGEIIPGDVVVRVGIVGNRTSTYDIGFFVGDGASSPINGESCTFDSLTPLESAGNPFDPSGPYRDLDGNMCGDASKGDGTIFKDFTLGNVLCQDQNNDGALDIQYAITWKQNAAACDDPTDPENFDLANTSKCINAIGDVGGIPVLPPDPDVPAIRVQKIAEPLIISPGEDVDYTVNVVNEGPITVTLDNLDDDRFGNLDGQGSCRLPQEIDPGQTYTCSFNTVVPGSAPSVHVNVVTGSGTGGGQPVSDTGRALVQIIDLTRAGIGYLVWYDLDADGAKDENEIGIPGVTVNLLDADDALLDTRITDDEGFYAFEGLTAGRYRVEVEETGPLGTLVLTTAYNPYEVSLLPGQVFTNANFGYVGAEITLEKSAEPQIIDAPGEPVDFTVTVTNSGVIPVLLTDLADDQFGNLFDSGACPPPPSTLAPGDTYTCPFTEQINGAPGDEHVNTVQAIAEDTVKGIPVFAADDAIVGIEDPASAAIGNLVWMDNNGNGSVDEGEFGLNNVTLRLLFDAEDNGDYETVVETTSTIANGEYAFVNLVAGKYRVEVTDNNQILKDKYLTNPPEPLDLSLAPGQVFLDADFGYADIPRPRIVVLKVPTQFVHEAPSADVTYRVTVLNVSATPVTITDLIDSRFGPLDGLADSTCEVNQTVSARNPYTCRFTENVTGDPGDIHRNRVTGTGVDSNGNVAFDSGPASILFVDPDDGAIGDQVWEDENANGVFDPGEPGLANVSLALFRGATQVDVTATDASGSYQFTGLGAGSYQVRVTDTAGVLAGKVLTGGSEPRDVNLGIGEIFVDADFGYATPAIELIKEGDPAVLVEPGGTVNYTITTRNVGYLDVTLTSLVDDKFGDLDGQGNCALPIALPARSSVACQFPASLSGAGGDIHTNTVTARAVDAEDNEVTAQAQFDVNFIGINFGAAGYVVWDDENRNGIRESSEPGIAGVTLDIEQDEDGNGSYEKLIASTVTRQNGFYAFIPIPTGDWRIRVTDQYGVLDGRLLTGGTNPNNFALDGGQVYRDANFGYYAPDGPPPIEPPPEPAPGVQSIPALSSWALWLLAAIVLGLGASATRHSRSRSR
jgi:hypothetical protein